MFDEAMLASYVSGDAIAVAARARWGLVAGASAMRYLDAIGLAALRAARPASRATPLAPVSIVTDVWSLEGVPDRSLDCLVGFHLLADADRAGEGFAAARRVLRAGGVLILPVPDQRYPTPPDQDVATLYAAMDRIEAAVCAARHDGEGWTTGRAIRLVASLPADWTGELEIEAAGRVGGEIVVALSKGAPGGHATGALFEHGGRVFVVDGRFARHVQHEHDLDRLRGAGTPIRTLPAAAFGRLAIGAPIRSAEIADFMRGIGRA